MQNIIMIKEPDRTKFERILCEIQTSKIIGEPKISKSGNDFMYSALVKMSPLEIEQILKG